jgi:hypothetical protein
MMKFKKIHNISIVSIIFMLCLSSLSLSLLSLSPTVSAWQYERTFPAHTKRGKLTMTELADVVIDGKLRVTAINLRIINEFGGYIAPASLWVKNAPINYTVNDYDEVDTIWVLTKEEASIPLPKRP